MSFAESQTEETYFDPGLFNFIQDALDQLQQADSAQVDHTTPTVQVPSTTFDEEPAGSSTMPQSVVGNTNATFQQDTSTSPTWEVQCAPTVLYNAMGNSQMGTQYGALDHLEMQGPPSNSYRYAGPAHLPAAVAPWQNPTPSPAHGHLLGNFPVQTAYHFQPNLTAQFAAPVLQSFAGAAMEQVPLATPMGPPAFAQYTYPINPSTVLLGTSFGQPLAYGNPYYPLNQQQTLYPASIQQHPTGVFQEMNYDFAPVQPQFPRTPSLEPGLLPGSPDFIAQPQTPPDDVPIAIESEKTIHAQMTTGSAVQVNYPPAPGPSLPAASLPSAPAAFEVTFVNYVPQVEPTTPAPIKKMLQKPAKVSKAAKATNASKPKNSRKRNEDNEKAQESLRQKRYPCDQCPQVCSSISDLKRHKESKLHSVKNYFCKVGACAHLEQPRSYTRIDALRRHWKNAHTPAELEGFL